MDVRIHFFFVLLPLLCMSLAYSLRLNTGRGFALAFFLLVAVCVREIARGLVGAWVSLSPVSLILLPTGALATYSQSDADADEYPAPNAGEGDLPAEISAEAAHANALRSAHQAKLRTVALAGPIANILFGLTLAGMILTFAPEIDLIQMPWVSPRHLLRAMVWTNLLLAAINLLPAWPLDGGYLFGKLLGRPRPVQTAIGIGPVVAVLLVAAGILVPNMFLVFIGAGLLIVSQFFDESGASTIEPRTETVLMRDVMMQDYTVISASATLEDAMRHCTHTLQDVFPVVRGGNLVGAVSRQNIVEALEAGGNSYVQGIMTRSFQTARPGDALVKTLRRLMSGRLGQTAQLVPVVDGEAGQRIVGIITPQNLQRSMSLLDLSRRMTRETDLRKEQDRP
ncbi:CBS domain-containing protein [Granulicella rosea]|uniref:CBS domain-containing protein n=1 Tax=Granulicella rosea TaxID=474952 RepID=UPI001FE712FD|nr:CBS domain-containing protein [Granulicella rosea]